MSVINRQSITRFSKYKSLLLKLKALGFKRVFSDNLAEAAGAAPAQVRKDFSLFNISGSKRGGYEVEELLATLNKILGKDKLQSVIIVGMEKLGVALLESKSFEEEEIKIAAAFDSDPAKVDRNRVIPIYPLEELRKFVKYSSVKIALLTTGDVIAQDACDLLVEAGILGILNFTSVRLKTPENVFVNNIDFYAELEKVFYFVNLMSDEK